MLISYYSITNIQKTLIFGVFLKLNCDIFTIMKKTKIQSKYHGVSVQKIRSLLQNRFLHGYCILLEKTTYL